jgi:hypothetical protein
MLHRIGFISLFALFAAIVPTTAQTQHRYQVETTQGTSGSHEDADLKADVQRMRVILSQMQSNLAFVQNTTTPLKHQFELEIEMWQVVLDEMEQRIRDTEPSNTQRRRN